jgi:hypothetical protein
LQVKEKKKKRIQSDKGDQRAEIEQRGKGSPVLAPLRACDSSSQKI